MTDPFLAEIRIFSGTFAPTGWALCNGQLMPISQNTALFSLLGTTYGGDGRTTFALPNLQGSAPLQQGHGAGLSLYELGQYGGAAQVQLLPSDLPTHTHQVVAVDALGTSNSPSAAAFATGRNGRVAARSYAQGTATNATMNPQAVGVTGGSQPHNNMPPYLALTFIIALQGIFPQRP